MTDATQIDAWLTAFLHGDSDAMASPEVSCAAIMERVRLHGIAAILAARPDLTAAMPDELRQAIVREARVLALWEDTHREVLLPALDAMAVAGAEVLVLKGTALAYSSYLQPFMRARGDTDLLVRPRAVGAARKALADCGFIPVEPRDAAAMQETWEKASSFGLRHSIDLHWRSHGRPSLSALLPTDDLFAGSLPLPRLAATARMPRPVFMMIAIILNQSGHRAQGFVVEGDRLVGETRLGWLYDVHLLAGAMRRADWEELVSRACAGKIATTLLATLRSAQTAFDSPLPDDVAQALAMDPAPDLLQDYFEARDGGRMLALDMASARGLRERWQVLRTHLLPARSFIGHRHEGGDNAWMIALYARRIAAYLRRRLRGAA